MNSITLKEYQQKITDKIFERADEFLKTFDGVSFKKILFRARSVFRGKLDIRAEFFCFADRISGDSDDLILGFFKFVF